MGNEFKRIVLLKGLQHISDYHFSMIKSLLAAELKLTSKMQEEYDRVKIADLMEVKFRGPACVEKLIALVKDIEEIKHLAKTLRNEKSKETTLRQCLNKNLPLRDVKNLPLIKPLVIRRSKAKEATPGKKSKQDKPKPDQSTSTTEKALGPESIKDTPVKKKKTIKTCESKKMKLTKEQSQRPGLSLTSTESKNLPQTPQMPPPITSSSSSTKKKKTIKTCESKKMKLTEEQSWLPGLSVTSTESKSLPQTPQMPPPTSSSSSLTKKKNDIATNISNLKKKLQSHKQSQMPGTSATSTCPARSGGQMSPVPPPTPFSNFSIKEEDDTYFWTQKLKDTTTETVDSKMKLSPAQRQLPQLPTFSIIPTGGCLQTPQMLSPTSSSSSSAKKPRLKAVPKEASREEGFHRDPKEVMVLKATEPFTYDVRDGEKKMFHATVATESQFFHVKVYHAALKEKFIPKKIIAISDYLGRNGFLEVFNASCVSDVDPDRKMEISKSLIQKANATPKISHLYMQDVGTFVNGVFLVQKKLVRNECIYYEIKDNTGVMEVLVYGQRLTGINCEEGDRLKLICFELALSGDKRQLRSVIHSFIKVTKARKIQGKPLDPDLYMETFF